MIPVEEGEGAHGPQMLPGGEWVLFTFRPSGGTSWDQTQIVVQSLATGERTVVIETGRDARYLPTGHLVYALNEVLLAVPFDLYERRVTGGPVPLIEGVARANAFSSAAAQFSVANNGLLVYAPAESFAPVVTGVATLRTLVWVDRQGQEEPLPVPPRGYAYPRLSPDGTRVALDVRDQEADIWIWNLARPALSRFTFVPGLDRFPAWSPDGQRIAFSSTRDGIATNVYWKAADGTGAVEPLTEESAGAGFPTSFSPDGRWLAYESDESGQLEIYVRPFPDVDGGGLWQVSTGGGTQPLWARNGRELFYRNEAALIAVAVQTEPNFTPATPEVLFEREYAGGPGGRSYDVSPDGEQFLMIKESSGEVTTAPQRFVVVQNWFEELRQRVPTN